MYEYPRIGTGVFIAKEGKILLGKRLSSYGKGTWCPPGGKLELYEDLYECARRETREEAGVEIERVRMIAVSNHPEPENGTHFVSLHFAADWKSGEPVPEPGAFERWEWFAWNELPQQLLLATRDFVELDINPFTAPEISR